MNASGIVAAGTIAACIGVVLLVCGLAAVGSGLLLLGIFGAIFGRLVA